jgi:cytochrome d ubiquinol oxidase subunit I
MAAETTRYAIEVPRLGSLILTHEWDGEVKGLKQWPRQDRPNAALLFWSFRVMVGIGVLMVLLGLWSALERCRGMLWTASWLHRFAILLGPAGFVAVLAGWVTTEAGRQPYTVYGLMRTSESVSPVAAPAVATSLAAFAIVYFAVFGAGVFYLLRLMRAAPTVDVARPALATEGGAPVLAGGTAGRLTAEGEVR